MRIKINFKSRKAFKIYIKLFYAIILHDYFTRLFYTIILHDYFTRLFYTIILRDYFTRLFYAIILRDYFTRLCGVCLKNILKLLNLKHKIKCANLFAFSHLRDCFATKAVVVWVYLIDDYYNACFIFA